MIRVEDNHVLGIVYDALASTVEFADYVDKRSFGASGIIPGVSQEDDKQHTRSFVFDREYLCVVRFGKQGVKMTSYFLGPFTSWFVLVLTFKNINDKVAFDGSAIDCGLFTLSAHISSNRALSKTHIILGSNAYGSFCGGCVCNPLP